MGDIQLITTALFINPQGRVIATHSDYSQKTFSGFNLERAQEIRCKDAMPHKILDVFCSPVITENIGNYTAQKVIDDLRGKGFTLHYEKIEIGETK